MFEVPFGGEWSLDRLASILGTMFVSAAFALIYLYTGELAPTTHRYIRPPNTAAFGIGEKTAVTYD